MSRLVPALLALVSLAAAAGDPDPVACEVEAYLASVESEPAPPSRGDVFCAALDRVEPGALLLAPAQGGPAGWASLRLDVWYPAIDGTVEDSGGGEFDSAELGLEDNEVTLVPRALLSLGGIGILVDAYVFETEGSGTVTTTVNFGGVTFPVSEDVESELDLVNVRGLVTLPVVKTGFLQLSLLAGITYYDIQLTVTGSVSGTGTATAQLAVPLVGALAQAKLGPLLLEVELTGLTASYGDYDVTYFDGQVSVGVTLVKIVAVRAGYRFTSLDGTIEDVELDGTLDGFFIGASVNF